MATPEAVLIERLAQSQEPGFLQQAQERETAPEGVIDQVIQERIRRLREREADRFNRIDSLNFILDSLSRPSRQDIEQVFFERLGQLHEQEPDQFPSPEDVEFGLAEMEDGGFIRTLHFKEDVGTRTEARVLNFWRAVEADLEERAERQASEIRGEILGESIAGFPSALRETVGGLDQFIREIDPTAGARETARRETSEGISALGELLRAGLERGRAGLGQARETLGQGATDLGFLLEQLIREEIVGSGEGTAGSPRARRAEEFAEGPRDRLLRRLLGER